MLELRTKFADMDKVAHVIPHNEFRDGFIPNASVTSIEGLLLCTLTLQSRDATFDDPLCTYPVALGHKNKSNIMHEKVMSMP